MNQTTVERIEPAAEDPRPAIRPITIVLPSAHPQIYLRWMRWWRACERRARERYEGTDLVSRLALAPHPSALFWDLIAQDISRQAGRAKRHGRTSITPRIRTTNVALVHGLGYMDRRQRFLEFGIAERPPTGIPRPADEFVELRCRVLHEAARQLVASAPSRSRSPQVVPRPRPRDVRLPRERAVHRRRARSRSRSHANHNPGQAA